MKKLIIIILNIWLKNMSKFLPIWIYFVISITIICNGLCLWFAFRQKESLNAPQYYSTTTTEEFDIEFGE